MQPPLVAVAPREPGGLIAGQLARLFSNAR